MVRSHVLLRLLWWGKPFFSSAFTLELKYKKAAVLVPGIRYDFCFRWNCAGISELRAETKFSSNPTYKPCSPPSTPISTMADVAPAPAQPLLDATANASSMVVDDQPTPALEEEQACETLYIQNLNEKIKPEVLKASLRGLFKSYGEVLDVVAHNNLRMRGQAFVSFASPEVARKAMKEVQRFPLYSKPMVRVLNLALMRRVCS